MKSILKLLALSLLIGLVPRLALGADASPDKRNLLGKFYVSSIYGHVECTSEDRIFDLKKGDVVLGRGATIKSYPGGNATLVFSNETTFFVDEKTELKINKFDQQPFLPNNNLVIEPSNTDTLVTVEGGRIVISTPQLLSGTSLVFETAHAHIAILNDQPGGQKAFIEVTDKQTHFALISGGASIQVRGSDGEFLSLGTRIKSSEQAYIRYTLTGQITMASSSGEAVSSGGAGTAAGAAPPAGGPAGPAPVPAPAVAGGAAFAQPAFSPNGNVVTVPGQATVLRVTGNALSQLTQSGEKTSVEAGDKLPQGAIITTSEDGEVYLQPFDGAISDIKPNSAVVVEKLADALANGVVQKRTALLDLKKGTLVSVLDPDPAKRKMDNYGVRTPRGIATAHGTSFSVSVTDNNFSVAATADSVTFVTPSGTTYSIVAGDITVTNAAGQAQPPIPLSQAVADDPAVARVVRTAVNTVSSVVQNNIGGLPSASAINLISQVVGVAAAAMPAQASAFTGEAVAAVNAPGASTSSSASAATASVTSASVTAVPAQAAQVAVASTRAAPSQANTIAAAAASAAPSQSVQVATSVLQVVTQGNAGQSMAAQTQTAAALATAVSLSVPAQAAPVTGALMQAIALANPQATAAATNQAGATLASAVSASVPAQAAPVAAAVMLSVTQSNPIQTTPAAISQTAATLAAAVTTTAPTQAVPVATALMQFVQQNTPAASEATAGLLTATVSDAVPGSGSAVTAAVATASGESSETVAQSAAAASSQAATTAATGASAAASAAAASQAGTTADTTVRTASAVAAADVTATTATRGSTSSATDTGVVQGTSIIVEKLAAGYLTDVANNLAGADSTVSFNTSTSGDNGGSSNSTSTTTNPTQSITATPTSPSTLPSDNSTSTDVTPGT